MRWESDIERHRVRRTLHAVKEKLEEALHLTREKLEEHKSATTTKTVTDRRR